MHGKQTSRLKYVQIQSRIERPAGKATGMMVFIEYIARDRERVSTFKLGGASHSTDLGVRAKEKCRASLVESTGSMRKVNRGMA